MTDLSEIADTAGTIEESQHDDDHDRLQSEDIDGSGLDVQNEYDGGWDSGSV